MCRTFGHDVPHLRAQRTDRLCGLAHLVVALGLIVDPLVVVLVVVKRLGVVILGVVLGLVVLLVRILLVLG